ncbi:hypothetical protein NKH36_15495 [Mesorhizobium sp. M1312]|uniref:hypothetical protein n=1 Tax=unclassified Mesorhizobium TaxID=325217 RepID=UPI003337B668
MLLAASLVRLGISAEVALADLDQGRALDQHLPALRNFDHAIVKAKIGGETYWLDATNDLQGGKAHNFVQADYGFALPLSSTGGLEKMPSPQLTSPSIQVTELFDFPRDPGDPLSLTVTSTYEGASADSMRNKLAGRSLSDVSDTYLKYYSKRYPGIQSAAKLNIVDRRDDNIVSVKESYKLPAAALAANDLAKNFPIQAADLGNSLPTPTAVGRTGPILLGGSVYRRHTITLRNLKARFSGEEIKSIVTPYVSLKTSWSSTPTEFEVQWNFQTLAMEVPAKAIADYLKSVDDIQMTPSGGTILPMKIPRIRPPMCRWPIRDWNNARPSSACCSCPCSLEFPCSWPTGAADAEFLLGEWKESWPPLTGCPGTIGGNRYSAAPLKALAPVSNCSLASRA